MIAALRLERSNKLVHGKLSLLPIGLLALVIQMEPLLGQDAVPSDSLAYWRSAGWIDPEEADRIIDDLQSAGAVLTSEDLRRLGLSEPSRDPATRADSFVAMPNSASRWRGQASLRMAWRPSEPGARIARLRFGRCGFSGNVHWRVDPDGQRLVRGGVDWRSKSWHITAGGVGLQHGLGLWCASPGRWSSLTAGTPLIQGRPGPVVYSGMDDRQALWGVAQTYRSRFGRFTSLVGRRQSSPRKSAYDLTRAVGVALRIGAVEVSGLAGRLGPTKGGSLAVTATSGLTVLKMESARWRPMDDSGSHTAWVANVRVGQRAWIIEGQMAGAAAGEGSPLGTRPPVLPGWHGWGWGLRGKVNLGSLTRLRCLLAQGENREMSSDHPRDRHSTVWELAMESRLRPAWRGEIRCRIKEYADNGWLDRLPWLVPEPFNARRRIQYVGLLSYQVSEWQLQAVARRMTEIRDEPSQEMASHRHRHLVTAKAEWSGWADWRLRANWGWAWGDDVDLVSVAAPVTGIVMPRHWGKWRGEWSLGCQHRTPLGAVQIAAVRRSPSRAESGAPELELLARWLADW